MPIRLDRNSLWLHKILETLHVPDMIRFRIEASLRDNMHWCGLQGLC
jgi:hypothetical protein